MELYKKILFVVISIQVALFSAFNVAAQTVTVSGVVKDAVTNEPLIAATVMVKGTTNGVSTDIDGNIPSRQSLRMFSYARSSVTRTRR